MPRAISPRIYVCVCAVLIVLTFLTVAISFAPIHGIWHIAIGLIIAVCKASLVILFFMHAITSDRLTWLVIAISAFWLGLLAVLTLSDYFTRGAVPFTPGH